MNKQIKYWLKNLLCWTLFYSSLAVANTCDIAQNILATNNAGNTLQEAIPLMLDNPQKHSIQTETDKDWFFLVDAKSGHNYLIITDQVGEGIDIRLELLQLNTANNEFEVIDDGNRHFEGGTEQVELPSANNNTAYYVGVEPTGFILRGKDTTYTICVEDVTPSITLANELNRTISADTDSSIVFKVVNSVGDPMTNRKVNFTFQERPENSNANLTTTDKGGFTSFAGEATVKFEPDKIGQYIITAMLEENSAIMTEVMLNVVAGAPAKLEPVVEHLDAIIGDAAVIFDLFDRFANRIAEPYPINFSLTKPNGEIKLESSTTNDENGQIPIPFNVNETGVYEITAIFENIEKKASVTLFRYGTIIGSPSETTTSFRGAISVNEDIPVEQEIEAFVGDNISIEEYIKVEDNNIGEFAQIIVVVSYPLFFEVEYFMILSSPDKSYTVKLWNNDVNSLEPFEEVILPAIKSVQLNNIKFQATGIFSIFFGYRLLRNNTIIFNGNSPIVLNIENYLE